MVPGSQFFIDGNFHLPVVKCTAADVEIKYFKFTMCYFYLKAYEREHVFRKKYTPLTSPRLPNKV